MLSGKTRSTASRATLALAIAASLAAPVAMAQQVAPGETATSDADRIFKLGTVHVQGERPTEAEKAEAVVAREQIELLEKKDVGTALALVPGVFHNRAQGGRYESNVMVRGYDLRAVPIMLDGIPVYIPYDGYSDLGRFTTADVASIQVAKGYSSVLYGHNTLGGAINIVTMRPDAPLEANAIVGIGSGNATELAANVGSLRGDWYVQAGLSQLERDYTPLAERYVGPDAEGIPVDSDRYNYNTRDRRGSVRVGYVPNASDEYVLSYSKQTAVKKPGRDPDHGFRPTTWEWPAWDRETVSFVSTTRFLDDRLYFKPRVYLDSFNNTMDWWRGLPQGSHYDDRAFGASAELGAELGERHLLKSMLSLKDERHREFTTNIHTGLVNAGSDQEVKQRFVSLALEDTITLNARWEAQLGALYTRRSADAAAMGENIDHLLEQYPQAGSMLSPTITAIDPQAALFFKPSEGHAFRASVARKTRFPSFKQVYSNYGSGSTVRCPNGATTCVPGTNVPLLALQNPGLEAEKALHFEVGYLGSPLPGMQLEGSLYYSRSKDTITRTNRDFVTFPGYAITQSINLPGVTERKGLDLGLQQTVSERVMLGLSWAWLHIRNKDNPGYRFTAMPSHFGYLYAQLRATDWLEVVPSLEFRSSSYDDTAGVNRNGGYGLANLKLAIAPPSWQHAKLSVGAENLFNKDYRGFDDTYPSPGRSWFMNLRVSFE